jgi:ketosteroid isomerase-like protein
MSDNAMRGAVRAFSDALASRDPGRVAPCIDDTIDWTVYGPVDLFPFFGPRRGKAAVIAMCGQAAAHLQFIRCEKEDALIEGDAAAGLVRLTAVDRRSGRTLSLRFAYFAHFRDGRLTAFKALLDSLDAAEQALGREISLSAVA